jgi:type IX secretion system PorP/SprF family membrane protein
LARKTEKNIQSDQFFLSGKKMRAMKTNNIALLILIVFVSWTATTSYGQDLNHTQYFSTPLNINPAFTGSSLGMRARFLFRDQWPQLPVDFKSFYFSADYGDRRLPGAGGLGIIILSDNPGYGLINTLTVGATFSVNLQTSENSSVLVGIKAAMLQTKVNWDDLIFGDQLDSRFGAVNLTNFSNPDANKRVVADFAIGGIVESGKEDGKFSYKVGMAIDHLFQPDISFFSNETSKIPRKWIGHADFFFVLTEANSPLKLNIGGVFQNQNKVSSLQLGMNLVKSNIFLGAWYKSAFNGLSPNTVLALNAGFRYVFQEDMSIKFIYSYDIQISSALQGTGGAHEISLVLDMAKLSLFGSGSGVGVEGSRRIRSNSGPYGCSEFQ